MKTYFKFSALFVLTAFLFGACSSSLGFSKRRYNKGYHVTIIKDQQRIPHKKAVTHQSLGLPSGDSKSELTAASLAPIDEVAVAQSFQKKPFGNLKTLVPAHFSANLKFHNSQFANLFSFSEHATSTNPNGFIATGKEPESNIKNYNNDRSFSLLWIAVVLIVFLWYLGFLAGWGSGGLINLLLILAFILLVLWLLRIL